MPDLVETPERTKAVITITLWSDGDFDVQGPLDNLLQFYGMIEVARDVATDHARRRQRVGDPASHGVERGGGHA